MGFEISLSRLLVQVMRKNRTFLLDRLEPFFGIQSFLRFHEFSTKQIMSNAASQAHYSIVDDNKSNDGDEELPIPFAGWWFQIFFISTPIWGNAPI